MKKTTRLGLLRHIETKYQLDDPELPAFAASTGPKAWLESVTLAAEEILRDAGLPTHVGPFFVHANGLWAEMPADFAALGREKVCAAAAAVWNDGRSVDVCYIRELVKGRELRAEWYAAKLLWFAHNARRALAREDNLAALEWGIRAGQAALGLNLVLEGWPLAAEVGRKVRERSPDQSERNAAWAAEDRRLAAGGVQSERERHQRIAKSVGAKPETVRTALRRRKKRAMITWVQSH